MTRMETLFRDYEEFEVETHQWITDTALTTADKRRRVDRKHLPGGGDRVAGERVMLHYVIYIKGGFVLSREASGHGIEDDGVFRLRENGEIVAEIKDPENIVCISWTPAERVRAQQAAAE